MTMTDEHHVALPKLYGAPAYGRPTRPIETDPRPPDPDDLPLEAFRTREEQALASGVLLHDVHVHAARQPARDLLPRLPHVPRAVNVGFVIL